MANPYQDFIAGKTSTLPQAPSFQGYTPESDYKGWIQKGGGFDDGYGKIKVSLDPKTRNINISAPKWYLDSAEFKEQVLPQFEQLKGKELTDTDFTTLVNSDMLKDIQKQADDVKIRHDAISDYRQQFPKASDDDALTYLRNSAAALQSDKDDSTQLVVGTNADGTPMTKSVKDYLDTFRKMGDAERGKRLQGALDNIDNPDISEKDRAIELSLVKVLKDKKVFEAGGGTKLMRGMDEFLARSDKYLPGKLVNQLTRIGNDGKTAAEASRKDIADNPAYQLEGLDLPAAVGGVSGDVFGIASEVAASGPLAELAVAKGAAAASKIPSIAGVVEDTAQGIRALETGNKAAQVTAGTVKSIPRDIAFGTQQAIADPESYNAPQDFAINTAINAATLGGAKLGGRLIGAVDTATNGNLLKASEAVGKFGARRLDNIESLPVIGKAMKAFSTNFIDQASPLRRAARSAWATNKITTNEYQEVSNAIRSAVQRGRGEANAYMRESPEFAQAYQLSETISNLGKDELAKAGKYVNAVQELQYAKAGKYKVSEQRMKELEDYVAGNQKPEYDQYRQSLADWNAKISDFGVQYGVLDEDLLKIMRDDPAFAAGYVRLQKNLPGVEDNIPAYQTASRNLKNKEVVKKLKGPASVDDLNDPFVVANDRLNALSELAAQNKINRIAVQAIGEGWVNGRVLQSADDLRLRNTLRNSFKEEREIVDNLVDTQVTKLETDLNKLVEDVEDFNGSGRVRVASRIQDAVDDMVDDISKDPKLNDEVMRLMDELGGGKEGSERVASLGVLSRNKKRITERLEKSLQSTELGREERADVVRMFENQVNDELEKELAVRGTTRGPLGSRFNELRQLNKELSPNSELQGDGVQAYYDRGTKGYYELADPDMVSYFNMRKTPGEDGWFARLMTNTSRVFKLTTTGINPTFLPVNLLRDIPQATVTSGVNMLSPSVSHRALLESMGMSKQEVDQLSREFDAFIANSTQFEISRHAEDALRSTRAIGKEVERGKVKSVAFNLANPKRSVRQIEDLFGEVEVATRSRVYRSRFDAAIQRGLSPDQAQTEALFYAANATTDFLNVGARVQNFVRTVPYLTAAINGKASFLRLWMLDPIGVASRLAAGFVTPAIWLTVHNLADDDLAEGYFKVPEWERQNNFIVMLDKDSYVKIPMSQELANIAAPFRERIEAHYGLEKNNFTETMAKFVLGQSPVSLAPLMNKDYTGNTNFGQAAGQIASTVVPQIFRQPIEMMTGTDIYTGANINPTDEQLIAQGQVQPGEEITPGDRTFAGRDSLILRTIADVTGIDQGTLQGSIKNYGGAVGQMLLNGLDKLAGAPSEQQGGKALGEALAGRFFGGSFDQANSDYYRAVEQLAQEKKILQANLTRITNEAYNSPDPSNLMATRTQLIDQFGQKVANFANAYGEFYSRSGGVQPFQLDALVRLLDLGPDQGAFEQGTYQADVLQQARSDSRADALRRATDVGLPTSNERDRYGRLLSDTAGALYEDTSKTSFANSIINQRIYGAPKQLAYEYAQVIKGDRRNGTRSLYDIEQKYFDRIDSLYEQAKGLKGKAAQDIYSQISDIQEEYMTKEFDPRIRPLLEKYGPEALMNNKQIFEEIGSRIMVPGDYTPFTSRKKQPYQKDDVEAYLLDRYGVGRVNQQNLPTDQQALDIIERVNNDLSAGRMSSASYKLDDLQDEIDSGRVYVDTGAMETIKRLIGIANRR